MTDSIGASAIARNQVFQDRVLLNLMTIAQYVMLEPGNAANHQQRVDYALKVLRGEAAVYQVALGVLTDALLLASADPSAPDFGVSDAALYARVNGLFNAYAEIYNPVA